MAETIVVSLEGREEVDRLLSQFAGRQLNNRTRRALRAGAKRFRTEMRDQARSRNDLPSTFRKTRTRAHRNPLGVSVSPKSPLSSIFEKGARRHTISPGGSGVLTNLGRMRGGAHFGDSAAGEASFFARGSVSHPGMDARPFIGPVFEAADDDAEREFTRILFEGID